MLYIQKKHNIPICLRIKLGTVGVAAQSKCCGFLDLNNCFSVNCNLDKNTPMMRKLEETLYRTIVKEQAKRKKIEARGERGIEPNLLNISNALDAYYLLNKLKMYCFYLSYRQIVQEDSIPYRPEALQLMDAVLNWCDQQRQLPPVLKLYQQIRHLYEGTDETETGEEAAFVRALQDARASYGEQSAEENLEVLSLLSNFAIIRLNQGDKRYDPYFLEVNNEMLNLLYGPGQKKRSKLPGSVVKNLTVVALRLEDQRFFARLKTAGLRPEKGAVFADAFDWVAQFLEQYKLRLRRQDRLTYYPYCKAMLEFRRGRFTRAYHALQHPTHTRELFINLNIKLLYLQILYEVYLMKPSMLETDEVEIEKVIESLRGMLRYESKQRRQISYQLTYFREFENLFRQLFRLAQLYYPQQYWIDAKAVRSKYRNLLQKIKLLPYGYRDWLAQKLSEMRPPGNL